ncbi:MAG: SDR family oxidoreductase [Hyphomicrobiales bacterium]
MNTVGVLSNNTRRSVVDLKDKVVLLTGGTAGIGREIARQMKAKGAKVTLTGRNPARLTAMREEGFDVMEAELSSARGVDTLLAEWGTKELDVLVNNAGYEIAHDFRAGEPDADAADDSVYTNLQAPVRLITGLMPTLRRSPLAAIVNVTSGLALAPAAGTPLYCGTKSALRFYTLGLREQLKDFGIHVVEALPPVVDTQAHEGKTYKKMPPEECARQILVAVERDRNEANVGMVNTLRLLESISPAFMRRMMLRSF